MVFRGYAYFRNVFILFLHTSIVDSRIKEELASFQVRGNSHRDVLENSCKTETLKHIALMEENAETEVVITDYNQRVIISSSNLDDEEQTLVSKKFEDVPRDGTTIVGAYDTTAYIISYNPTSGGKRVENHKWIIQEEIIDASEKTFQPGEEVATEAYHMEGMKNAKVMIESAEQTTVYMIDFTPTNSEEVIKKS